MTKTTVSAYPRSHCSPRHHQRRNRSQVVSMALDFFVELPTPAREAWLKIITIGSPQQIESFMETIVRVSLTAQYQMTQGGDIAAREADHLELLESDILEQWQ